LSKFCSRNSKIYKYRQAWEAIVVGVETGGVDPHLFDVITNNTLVVLGLLDADGNPAGLGEGLTGECAKTWLAMVGRLPT